MERVFSLFKNREYTDIFSNVEILGNRTSDIFLRCKKINITIPIYEKNNETELNIFEMSILRMLKHGKFSPEIISEKICLEKDLIENIILTLQEKEFLNEDCTLSNEGFNLINRVKENSIKKEKKIISLFIENTSEKILPYINIGRFETEYLEIKKDIDKSIMKIGTTGEERIIRGSYVSMPNKPFDIRSIKEYNIRSAINKYNRYTNDHKIKIDRNESIEIQPIYEDVIIHLKMLIQNGDAQRIIVSDGFQPSVKELEELFDLKDDPYINEIKKQLREKALEIKNNTLSEDEKQENEEEKLSKYSKIDLKIKELKKLNDVEQEQTRDLYQEDLNKNHKKIEIYFDILEWALFYYLKENYPRHIDVLVNDSSENKEILSTILSKYKVNYDENKLKLISKYGNINKIIERKDSSFKMLLPLAIIDSKYNPTSKFLNLIKNLNFIVDLFDFLDHRNKIKHGNKIKPEKIEEKLEKFEKLTEKILDTLLNIEIKNKEIILKSTKEISNEKNKAILEMESIFGNFYYNLNMQIRIKIEEFIINKLRKSYSNILINDLHDILENFLGDYVKSIDKNLENLEKLDDIVKEKIKKDLPETIEKVKRSNIKNTYNNRNASLGAYLKVLYSELDDLIIEKLENECNLINISGNLIGRRGHGNDIYELSSEEIDMYSDCIFKTIKILGE